MIGCALISFLLTSGATMVDTRKRLAIHGPGQLQDRELRLLLLEIGCLPVQSLSDLTPVIVISSLRCVSKRVIVVAYDHVWI
jgi:hypothetical protein